MNVLIAGGSGFLGSNLTNQLLQNGHRVWILSRNPERLYLPDGVAGVGWDAKTVAGWGHIVEEMDAVVNLTGENLASGIWTPARKNRFLSSRVDSGRAIVEAIRDAQRRPKVLLQSSAIGYYGNSEDRIVAEDSPAGEDFLSQLCILWEDSTRPVEHYGVRRIIIRTSPVFSKNSLILRMFMLPFKMFIGGKLGSGKQWVPWIHIEDQIGAILHLMQNKKCNGPYNLAAPEMLRNVELEKTIAESLNRPYWLPVPAFALRIALGEMSQMVLEGQRAVCTKLLKSGYTFKYPTLDGALSDILSLPAFG